MASEEFCRVHWTGEALSDDEFRRFVAGMAPEQVAIGMQSFIGTDIGRIRRLIAELRERSDRLSPACAAPNR